MDINNNILQKNNVLFGLNKFRKIKKDHYDTKEECQKDEYKWVQTNPRFKSFDQLYFHAGDQKDISKYGLLPLRYFYSFEKEKRFETKKNKTNEKIFKLYKKIDYTSIVNTFEYMFYKFKKGIFVIIHNNKLVVYLPFSNYYYENDWYKQTYFSEEERKLLQTENYNSIKGKLIENIKKFQDEHPEQYLKSKYKINFNRKKWVANNCIFRNQFPEYEGDLNTNIYKSMLEDLLKERTIPDVEFFINQRDFPILKKDYTEAYDNLFDGDSIPLDPKYKFKKMCPIFSKSATDKFADLLIPNEDDWRRVSNKFFREECSDSYRQEKLEKLNYDWKTKKPVCIFRGSATGCGITLDTNMRLKAADLSLDYPKILDAGITKWNSKPKKYKNKPIMIINEAGFRFKLASMINDVEKSGFKYILNIDGHVSACRLSTELGMNSVILLVQSKYKLWFSDLLIPYIHYIPIMSDLSDLIEKIKWCIKNDKKCEEIAKNAREFYLKYLQKDGVFDYIQSKLRMIYENKNFKNLLDIGIKNRGKKNIALISCYRDTGNGERLRELKYFVTVMNKLMAPYCNFHIFIIEQSDDGHLFNIGKLKNIGFKMATTSIFQLEFDQFIFSDIDLIPDYDLIEYYTKVSKLPISLAYRGTRWENMDSEEIKKPFMGAVISYSGELFEKINGYGNNFWGWGGEDDDLLLRLSFLKNITILYPKKGSVIDIDEKDMKPLSTNEKLKNVKKEPFRIEKWWADLTIWKENGLNNLNYKLLEEKKINEHTTLYKVNLLKEEDMKNHPNWFPQNSFKNEDEYKKIKRELRDIMNSIPQKEF